MNITIGITTFQHRFEKYFKPLVRQIREQSDVEIIVYINAQYGREFDKEYRRNMLNFLAEYDNIFPTFTPHFKGLSKMWNNIIVNSTNNNILICNDDVSIRENFIAELNHVISTNNTSFKINGSFSHFVVSREEVFRVGFFDERLIGLGEEDGDWCFRFERYYQKHLPSFNTPNMISYSTNKDSELAKDEVTPCNSKYVRWNADWIFQNKYDPNNEELGIAQGFPANGQGGMFGKPVAIREFEDLNFYPAEEFFWKHIGELKNLRKL